VLGMMLRAELQSQSVHRELADLHCPFIGPLYNLRLAGSSLDATRDPLPAGLVVRCVALCTPCVVSAGLAESCSDFVTSLIHGDDFIPRINVAVSQTRHNWLAAS
jgi:hypothetical protein